MTEDMTERELAEQTLDALCIGLGGIDQRRVMLKDRERIAGMVEVWRREVVKLEAAEKEAEKPHVTNRDLDERVTYVSDHLGQFVGELGRANKKIEDLEAEIQKVREWCAKHSHYFETSPVSQVSPATSDKVWETRGPRNVKQL